MKQHFRILLRLLCLAAVTIGCSVGIYAQTVTGTLQGTVVDTNKALVPGATIVIKNVETGQERTLVTNNDGSYLAPFLALGSYDVKASAQGFGAITKEGVRVSLNDTATVSFILNPTVSEAVTVSGDAVTINTTSGEIKQSLATEEIVNKPTFNQGSFLSLAETFTGYQENPTSGQNNPTVSSGSSINFNGTGTRGATFQINGVNNDDSSENQNRQGASLATIKEFQVITNIPSAEFGRGYGGIVLVQTKSGTNKVHGEVYEYNNVSALNAKSFFSSVKKPVNRRNQFGGVVGFPMLHDRLFGFVSFDRVRRTGSLNYTRDVLLAGERNPANWFLKTPANNTPANRAFIQSVVNRFPADRVPNDSRSSRTYAGAVGINQPLNDYSGRFDWNPKSSDSVTGRWQYTRQIFDNEDIIIGEATRQNNKQQNIGSTWTHVFSPSLVGEFRYGLGLRTTLVGIKAGNDTPIIRFSASPVSGSIIGNAGAFPITRYQTDHQFVYNLSAVHGAHNVKAGTDIRRQQLNDFADNFSRGFYTFSSSCNSVTYASSYEAFLNGCVATFQKGYGPFFLENRINESNFYVQDGWKIRPNLTLSIGARYEYVSAPREIKNRVNYGYQTDKNNIEPRVGFAYSPSFESALLKKAFGGPGDSAIRGGFGIQHGRLFQSVFSQSGATVRFNPPNAVFLSFTNSTLLSDPTNGFVFTPGPQTVRHGEAHVDPGLEMPYTEQWGLSFERLLPLKSKLTVSYNGNRGIGLVRFAQENLPTHNLSGVLVANHPNNAPAILYTAANRTAGDPRAVDVRGQTIKLASNALCAGTGLPNVAPTTLCPVAVTLGPLEYSFRVPRTNERRPSGDFTTNTFVSNSAWSYYHALQVEWTKKLSKGLLYSVNYTWSKAIDTNSEATFVGAGDTNANGNDSRVSRALSRFHTPHRATIYVSYTVPKFGDGRGFFDGNGFRWQALIQDWTISTVAKFSAGTPLTLTNSNGFGDLNFDGFTELRPAVVDPAVIGQHLTNPNTSRQQVPASAFRTPILSDYGCCILGRNTFYADGIQNYDISLFRTVRLPWEGHRATVRADFFNAFNHVQYGFPNLDLASSNYGKILGTATQYSPRTVQFSFRYQF